MKALFTFSFVLGLIMSLNAYASPDMTHNSRVGSTAGFTKDEAALESCQTDGECSGDQRCIRGNCY